MRAQLVVVISSQPVKTLSFKDMAQASKWREEFFSLTRKKISLAYQNLVVIRLVADAHLQAGEEFWPTPDEVFNSIPWPPGFLLPQLKVSGPKTIILA